MNRQTALIIADPAELARDVVGRWQMERTVPSFTLMSSELWDGSNSASCDLAVVVGLREAQLFKVMNAIESMGTVSICLAKETSAVQTLRAEFSRALVVRQHEGWLDSLVVLGAEVLRRVEASARAKRADHAVTSSLSHAALGRYMLEMRHGFNNALTSVLGNAELLLMQAGELPEEKREQMDTIHSMALRLHEMMQRFSSLEAEMFFTDKESQHEIPARSQAYVPGS